MSRAPASRLPRRFRFVPLLAAFREMLALDPTGEEAGVELAKNGRSDEARQAFEDALRRNPGDAQARKALEAL